MFLLAVTIYIDSYFLLTKNFSYSVLFLSLSAFQIYLVARFINRVNKEVTDFIKGINYSDFTQNVRIGKLGGTFRELSNEMDKLISKFKDTRFEKEENLKYLQTIVEHVGIGLISFNTKGEVELINKAAKKMLKLTHLQNIFSLDKTFNGLGTFVFQMVAERKSTFKIILDEEEIQLMIQGTEFRMKNQQLKLISLYNIQSELEEKEIEAWQKLIRVLTHEIMNSITPISSLASTAGSMLKNTSQDKPSPESLEDIKQALETIQRRSEGLSGFINKFRDIGKIPKPNFQTFPVSELFYRIRLLVEKNLESRNVSFSISINPDNMELVADPALLEQVLLNLINNSINAFENIDNPVLKISAEINERGRAVIKVIDNGPGISNEVLDKVFVPFFTTRKEGSGIGLSISQSIIRAHGGKIWVQSKPSEETIFTIRL